MSDNTQLVWAFPKVPKMIYGRAWLPLRLTFASSFRQIEREGGEGGRDGGMGPVLNLVQTQQAATMKGIFFYQGLPARLLWQFNPLPKHKHGESESEREGEYKERWRVTKKAAESLVIWFLPHTDSVLHNFSESVNALPGAKMIHRAVFLYKLWNKSQKLYNIHMQPLSKLSQFSKGMSNFTQHGQVTKHCCRKWMQQCPVVLHSVMCTGLLARTGASIVIDALI